MMKNKLFTKLIAFSLVLFSVGTNVGNVFAAEKNTRLPEEFLNASDDTIVVYMEGVPVKKSEVDENGVIKEKKLKEIEEIVEYQKHSRAATSVTRTIPSGYNQAIVRTTLKAPSYSQINTQYYYTYKNGAKFASGIEQKSWSTITGTILGYVPIIGNAVSILFTADSLYKASIAGKIRNYTNNGKKVRITESKSKYGTFYGVFAWTNRTIETHKKYTSGTTETINNLQYIK